MSAKKGSKKGWHLEGDTRFSFFKKEISKNIINTFRFRNCCKVCVEETHVVILAPVQKKNACEKTTTNPDRS